MALLWSEVSEVTIQNYSLRPINAIVSLRELSSSWKLTGFYGHPDHSRREESWNLLAYLQHFSPQPWLCVGDFNEIVDQAEKVGGPPRSERQMEQFRDTLESCQLNDLGFQGSMWNNSREAAFFTKERLDRATATRSWCDLFREVDVSILAAITSDHKPMLVSFSTTAIRWVPKRTFKFEAKWDLDGGCGDLIKTVWAAQAVGSSSMQTVQLKLQKCQHALTS